MISHRKIQFDRWDKIEMGFVLHRPSKDLRKGFPLIYIYRDVIIL